MSLAVDDPDPRASLRAMAHPLRLQLLSLLTGAALSAAEVARELDLTHANASYHLRQLLAAGLIVVEGEESIRGGRAKRYRYVGHRAGAESRFPKDPASRLATWAAASDELVRRAHRQQSGPRQLLVDAELWVDVDEWDSFVSQVREAGRRLHDAARPPRAPGTTRISATLAIFEMAPEKDSRTTYDSGATKRGKS